MAPHKTGDRNRFSEKKKNKNESKKVILQKEKFKKKPRMKTKIQSLSKENGYAENKTLSGKMNVVPGDEKNLASVTEARPVKRVTFDITPSAAMEVDEPRISQDKIDGKNLRTIFVGNLPLSTKKQSLKKIFSKYGKIESTRIRCASLNKGEGPRFVALLKRDFHPKATHMIGYVKFKDMESVSKVLKETGLVYEGHTLRIDKACPESTELHTENAIFVGNLPYVVPDDELRNIFLDCGEIESVRIIRDKMTGIGKGFGYVNFKSTDSVELALQLRGSMLRNRQIRIKRAVENVDSNKNTNSETKKRNLIKEERSIPVRSGFVAKKKAKKPKDKNKIKRGYQGHSATNKVVKKDKSKKKIRKEKERRCLLKVLNKD